MIQRNELAGQSAIPPAATQPDLPQPVVSAPRVRLEQAAVLQAAVSSRGQRNNLIWANAMAQVAGELPADDSIPPLPRRSNKIWSDALGSSASHLAMDAAARSQLVAAAPAGQLKPPKPR